MRYLFPSPCLLCGYLYETLCPQCYVAIPFFPHIRELFTLKVCCALYYDKDHDLVPRLIYPFKYSHQADLSRLLAPPMKRALELLINNFEDLVLVPVPLHPKKELDRGYNQADLLARAVARALGGSLWTGLKRVKQSGSQAKVKLRKERAANIEGAFLCKGPLPSGQIVLVDDIVTSGSTLLECARALRKAGARDIIALTLADREKNPNFGHGRIS